MRARRSDAAAPKPFSCAALFFEVLLISAFTFGGGFVIVTLMKHRFVDELHWLEEQELLDYTAIAQSSPGPIAVNAAILVGGRLGGRRGTLAAILGTVLPPLVILSILSLCYDLVKDSAPVASALRAMQAAVAAVIADVVIKLGSNVVKQKSPLHIALMGATFAAVYFLRVNVIYVILACAALGVVLTLVKRKEAGK